MIFSTKLNKIGNSIAVLIPKSQLEYMELSNGDDIEFFVNKVNKKALRKKHKVFRTKISVVGGSRGFYLNKEVVKELGLKQGVFVEVLYKKVIVDG